MDYIETASVDHYPGPTPEGISSRAGLAKQASQITMYDVKSYYNQAKNMVLNLSEMEAKVAEATNDDPWGASSTLMQEIADGTHNFAQFNEIMPTIYSRFMEKEAREWRQIYKALTLLEFLVKNGSERVVDDARAHISTIKMLRSFHYIDEKGKDQGINVRNRSSEIALLLSDVDKIRQERRKAKANKSKYQGTGNDGGMSFITSGGSRYGGFGSESLGSGGGGGAGGEGSSRYGGSSGYENDHYRPSRSAGHDRSAPAEYDEYEGADDFDDDQPPRRAPSSSSSRRPNPPPKGEPRKKETPKAPEPPAPKAKEVNLFDFDDDEPAPTAAPAATAPAASSNILGGDDDFDDFQSGPSTSPPPAFAAAAPQAQNGANANLFDLLNSSAPSAPASQTQSHAKAPSFSQPSYHPQPSFNLAQPVQPAMTSRPSYTSTASQPAAPAAKPKPSGGLGGFDDLWNTSLTSAGGTVAQKPTGGKTMGDLDREKAMGSLWGKTQQQQAAGGFGGAPASGGSKPAGGSGFDDLLM